MRAGDRLRTDVLRTTLAAVANAEAVPTTARPNVSGRDEVTEVERWNLDEAAVAEIVRREIDELRAEIARRRERGVPAGDLGERVVVLGRYVGPGPSEDARGPAAP
jgi:hypothetical protein